MSGLILAVALAQLSLGRASLDCASHLTGSPASSTSHEGMNMPDAAAVEMGAQADASPPDGLPPCHHTGGAADCGSMTSCASTTAESQAASSDAVRLSAAVIVGAVVELASTTPSPDTPPPRV